MTFPRGVLLSSALAFAFFGAWAFFAPENQLSLVEVGVPTATARADVRAQYGGFTLGMGVFLLACLARRGWTAPGLLGSACALTGFVLARAVGVITDGPVSPTIYCLMAMEGAGAALSWIGWRLSAKG